MKFTVKRTEMLKAVKTALKAVGGLKEVSAASGLLIEANSSNGIVSVTGTDALIRIQCRVKAVSVEKEGQMVLMPILSDMLKLLDGETVEFAFDPIENNSVNIRAGKACYCVHYLDAKEFPNITVPFPKDMICIKGINSLIHRTAFAAGTNISDVKQKALECVRIKFSGLNATAEASNGIFIAVSDASNCSDGQLELLLHGNAIKALSEVVSAEDTLYAGISGKFAVFMKSDMIFYAMLRNEQFIDTSRVLTNLAPQYQATVNAKQLYSLINNVTALLMDKDDRCVNLSTEQGKITACCLTATGASKASIDAVTNTLTPPEGFNYVPKLLLDCLQRVSGPVNICFNARGFLLIAGNQSRYLVGPRKPVVIIEEKPKAEKKARQKKTAAKAA